MMVVRATRLMMVWAMVLMRSTISWLTAGCTIDWGTRWGTICTTACDS